MKPDFVWIVHNNCSRSCRHCFCSPFTQDDAAGTEKLIRDLDKHGIESKVYATNQMDEQLKRIYHKVNDAGLLAGHEAKAEMIDMRPDVNFVSFSIHGPDAETHELIAPKGDFEKTIANIKEFTSGKKDFEFEVYTVYHGKNYAKLEETCRLVHELGASRAMILKLSYGGRAMDLDSDFFLEQDQILTFLRKFHQIKNRFDSMKMYLIDNWGPQHSKLRQLQMGFRARSEIDKYCSTITDHVTIKSDSRDVYPCRFSLSVPELKIGHFDSEEGLVIDHHWFENLREKIEEPCQSCKILNICQGGCRGEAVGEKLRRDGVVDIYAGFRNCAVALGLFKWTDTVFAIPAAMKRLGRAITS